MDHSVRCPFAPSRTLLQVGEILNAPQFLLMFRGAHFLISMASLITARHVMTSDWEIFTFFMAVCLANSFSKWRLASLGSLSYLVLSKEQVADHVKTPEASFYLIMLLFGG